MTGFHPLGGAPLASDPRQEAVTGTLDAQETEAGMNEREHWHLDKRVPIALIVTLALQGSAGVWWASDANQRLSQIERRLEGFGRRSEALEVEVADQGTQIAVVAARLDDTNRNLELLRAELSTTNNLIRQLLSQRTEE